MKSKTTLLTQICQIALITGMLLSTSMLSAQSMQDTVIANFSLLEKIPHEKVYLHLDKPFYGAGEKIWFKGYLINAITHQDDSQSNFIITELINRSDFSFRAQRNGDFHIKPFQRQFLLRNGYVQRWSYQTI